MASSKEYVSFLSDQLSLLQEITFRPMMGEYLLYYRQKLIGGVYDDRLLVKPTDRAKKMMPDAPFALPYEGAKEMLLVENADDREFLKDLLEAIYQELPDPKSKSR